jgi:DNA-binding transcriptional LysR family regulator
MHQVRYFLAVSRTLNFTRAAEECHVAQPSLTRAIKLLEAELGADLFRRERNFTHLTDFGRRMLPLLRQCYDSAAAAKSLASSLRSGTVASLTLALSHTVSLALLVDPLAEVARVFPGLELKILRGNAGEIAEHLKKGEAALAVAGPLGETWERLDTWHLFDESFLAVVAAGHRLAARECVPLQELAPERLLHRAYCELAAPLTERLRDEGMAWSGHEILGEQDLVAIVGAGFGIAFVPRSTLLALGLRGLEVDGLDLRRTVSLYAVAGRERSPPVTALMKLLRARDWSSAAEPRSAAAKRLENVGDVHPAAEVRIDEPPRHEASAVDHESRR